MIRLARFRIAIVLFAVSTPLRTCFRPGTAARPNPRRDQSGVNDPRTTGDVPVDRF